MTKLKGGFKAFISRKEPTKWEYALAAAFAAVVFLLFAHPDIIETSNHTWLFLDNLFSGNLLGFYENVYAHENSLYYINAAHYNIIVYAFMGLWQLPVYIICTLFGAEPNETALMLYTKLLCGGLAALCGVLTSKIAYVISKDKALSKWQALLFVLSPLTLLSVFTMGQYDVLCLVLMLWAFLFYTKKKYIHFSLIMGVALCCKFFAAFWLIPLLLLCEKRILHLIKYFAIAMWLCVPTSLLYSGRDGDMGFFNSLISERMFSLSVQTGAGEASVILLIFAVLAVLCRLYCPKNDTELIKAGLYSSLAAFSVLFLCVGWHPQWLVLLVPFMLLASMQSKNGTTWFAVDVIIAFGVMLSGFLKFPFQIEANMLDFGVLSLFGVNAITGTEYNSLAFYISLIPYLARLASVMLGGGLLAYVIFHFPKNGEPIETALGTTQAVYPRVKLWLTFGAGFVAAFIIPVAFEFVKALV